MKAPLLTQLWRGLCEFLQHGSPWDSSSNKGDSILPAGLSDKLPWLGFCDNFVLLEDARSVAAVLELQSVNVNGQENAAEKLCDDLQNMLAIALPRDVKSPWVLQFFAWRESIQVNEVAQRYRTYAGEKQGSPHGYSDYFIDNILLPHLLRLCTPQGSFEDPLSGRQWSGCRRRIFLVCYRRYSLSLSHNDHPAQALRKWLENLLAQLHVCGIKTHQLSLQEIYQWLHGWFNPTEKQAITPESMQLTKEALHQVYDFSLSDAIMGRKVSSDIKERCWYFDELPHTLLSLERLRLAPLAGHISAEFFDGQKLSCLFDELPEGSVFCITITLTSEENTEKHLQRMEKNARGASATARLSRSVADEVHQQALQGNPIYPCSVTIYLRANTVEELRQEVINTDALLLAHGLQLLQPDYDLTVLDAYLGHLPMAFKHQHPLLKWRNHYLYCRHMAALLPLYGGATGSARPGITFFNRAGELFTFDPLNLADRSRNAHLFLFGPTGAGKSATLVYLLMLFMCLYRPRIVVIEAGGSFKLLSQHFAKHDLEVEDVVLKPGCQHRLPPFVGATALLSDLTSGNDKTNMAGGRDRLGEYMNIAKLMVTGGEAREEQKFSRSDEAILYQALSLAVAHCVKEQRDPLPEDMSAALLDLAPQQGSQEGRVRSMAKAMSLFTKGFAGELFNQQGSTWSDADFIRMDMGVLAGEGYTDLLSVAYIGLLNAVLARAEQTQNEGRPTILLLDEAHVITSNPTLSAYVVKVIKLLGRRLGVWFWMASQNINDFADEAEKMLAMFEWWLCLHTGNSELRELERFRKLSDHTAALLSSTRKVPGKYGEGVVLAETIQGLFRSVLPPLVLALAQSEQEEKARRAKLMQQHGCSELEATEIIASQMAGSPLPSLPPT